MFCDRCGHQMGPDDKFCAQCGKAAAAANAPASTPACEPRVARHIQLLGILWVARGVLRADRKSVV